MLKVLHKYLEKNVLKSNLFLAEYGHTCSGYIIICLWKMSLKYLKSLSISGQSACMILTLPVPALRTRTLPISRYGQVNDAKFYSSRPLFNNNGRDVLHNYTHYDIKGSTALFQYSRCKGILALFV